MTEETDQRVHFKKLTDEEKHSKLSQLARSTENKITIWKKGETKKYDVSPIQYFRSKSDIQVDGDVSETLFGQEVLYSYELAGLHFFGKSKLVSLTKDKMYLECHTELFKSERRANFRLLTFPHQQVFIHIPVPQEEQIKSNLVNFSTKTSETGLFNNFLDVINDKGAEKIIDGHLKLRVIDISVTGLAAQLGYTENSLFEEVNVELGPIELEFNGVMIKIPNAKILYKLDYLARDKKTRMYKAGIHFLEVNTNLDEELSNLINLTLRSLESEFEDFLK
jgi:c-di-GMP-binding flagellar brake protein YcgR